MTRPPDSFGQPGYSESYPDSGSDGQAGYGHGYEPWTYRGDTVDRRWDQDPEPVHRGDSWNVGDGYRDPGGYGDQRSPDPTGHSSATPGWAAPRSTTAWPGTPSTSAPTSGVPLSEQPTTHFPAVSGFGPPDTGPPDTGRPPRKAGGGSPKGRLVAVLAGVAVLLVAGLLWVGGGRSGPDDESIPPDLARPAKVVDRWLTAMFIRKEPEEMLRYTCKREAHRAQVDDAIKSVRKAERDAKVAKLTMKVSWSEPTEVSEDDGEAEVRSTLTVVVGKRTQKTPTNFGLVFEAGWRVCDTDLA